MSSPACLMIGSGIMYFKVRKSAMGLDRMQLLVIHYTSDQCVSWNPDQLVLNVITHVSDQVYHGTCALRTQLVLLVI